MSVESQVESLVQEVMGLSQADGPPQAFGDRFKELVKKMLANLENISPEEQATLVAAAAAMIAAFGAGNYLGGFLAFLEFMRLYRKAIKPDAPVAPAAV